MKTPKSKNKDRLPHITRRRPHIMCFNHRSNYSSGCPSCPNNNNVNNQNHNGTRDHHHKHSNIHKLKHNRKHNCNHNHRAKAIFNYLAQPENINQQPLSSLLQNQPWEGGCYGNTYEPYTPHQVTMPASRSETPEESSVPRTPEFQYDHTFSMRNHESSSSKNNSHRIAESTNGQLSCSDHAHHPADVGRYLPRPSASYFVQPHSNMYGQPSQSDALYSSGAVNPQQLQSHTLPGHGRSSPATTSFYGHEQTASLYYRPGQCTENFSGANQHTVSARLSPSSAFSDSPDPNNSWTHEFAQSDDGTPRHTPYNQHLLRCLNESELKELPLRDIYQWFVDNTEKEWGAGEKAWQNSIRHNLSQHHDFKRGSRYQGNTKKHMWHLSDEAIETNFVLPTTRDRPKDHRKRANTAPATQRQISGAKGGNATRQSARLKNKKNGLPRSSRHSSVQPTSRSHAKSTPPNMSPRLDVSYPSPTMRNGPRYNSEQAFNAPYYSPTPTPFMGNVHFENRLSDNNVEYQQDFTDASLQPGLYVTGHEQNIFSQFPEQQGLPGFYEHQAYPSYTEEQFVQNQFGAAHFDSSIPMGQWHLNGMDYNTYNWHTPQQPMGMAALPNASGLINIDPNIQNFPPQQQDHVLPSIEQDTPDFGFTDQRYVNMDHNTVVVSSDEEHDNARTAANAEMNHDWDLDFIIPDEEE